MSARPIFTVSMFLALGLLLAFTVLTSVKAQNFTEQTSFGAKTDNYSYMLPFSAGVDKVGFFDTQSGKIYIYDISQNRCEKILQLQNLGSPLLELRKN